MPTATSPRRSPPDAARAGSAPPAYTLYGEHHQHGLGDVLHVETIAHRSRAHDWEIQPHRHAELFQILVIRSGALEARLDLRTQQLEGPCAITVPALAVHGFRFAPDIDGAVFTAVELQLAAIADGQPAVAIAWRETLQQLRALAPAPPALLDAADALREAYAVHDRWRAVAVDTGLRRLLLELARAMPAAAGGSAAAAPRAVVHAQRLRALVDAQYRRQPDIASLAAQLGITPTQLNRVCRRVLGQSALAVLHTRLLLEAQRELRYTTMTIQQIALGLGFADPAYFTRFFQRLTGSSPSAWRTAARPR